MERWSTPLNDAGASFDMVVEPDGAAESLLGTASRTAADLVVVGRHDHGAFSGTLGGVSQRVLAYAPCPAIVMPTLTRAPDDVGSE
jgi:nucleotide-binding universal stress UspA family protein